MNINECTSSSTRFGYPGNECLDHINYLKMSCIDQKLSTAN